MHVLSSTFVWLSSGWAVHGLAGLGMGSACGELDMCCAGHGTDCSWSCLGMV
jgi:hypothetical protein